MADADHLLRAVVTDQPRTCVICDTVRNRILVSHAGNGHTTHRTLRKDLLAGGTGPLRSGIHAETTYKKLQIIVTSNNLKQWKTN